jgi:hypothetical protein
MAENKGDDVLRWLMKMKPEPFTPKAKKKASKPMKAKPQK